MFIKIFQSDRFNKKTNSISIERQLKSDGNENKVQNENAVTLKAV